MMYVVYIENGCEYVSVYVVWFGSWRVQVPSLNKKQFNSYLYSNEGDASEYLS